jgi:hypothetical protein
VRLRQATGFGVALALACAFPSVAAAAGRFAEPGGDGAEPCGQADPCDIETAVNSASGGDDITLLAGTYAPTVALGVNPSPIFNITIHGSPGARPVVNFAGNNSAAFYIEPGSTLRDVDVNSTGSTATAVLAFGGGALERVVAHASGASSRACLVEGESTIHDSVCWFTGTASADSSALSVDSFGGVETDVARNVTAVATSGPGIRVRSNASINGGVTLNATNVFARGAGGAGGEDVRTDRFGIGSTPIQKVNLDHSNFVTVSEQDSGDITDTGTAGNITTAPAFVNANAGDFHQLGTSDGTLNQGSATGQQPLERDIDGEARAMGSVPDIGADEFGEAPSPPTITGTDPPSGSNENNPLLIGTAEPFSFVHVFASSDCTGTEAGAEVAEEFASPGIGVSVPDDSTTTFTANAVNDTGTSECSTPFTYTEVTTQPPPTITPTPPSGGTPSQPVTAAKKKCKKKKQHRPASVAKKKKCKKKKKG